MFLGRYNTLRDQISGFYSSLCYLQLACQLENYRLLPPVFIPLKIQPSEFQLPLIYNILEIKATLLSFYMYLYYWFYFHFVFLFNIHNYINAFYFMSIFISCFNYLIMIFNCLYHIYILYGSMCMESCAFRSERHRSSDN